MSPDPPQSLELSSCLPGRRLRWATHYYASGLAEEPAGIEVVGGKTGTTDEAGACVILLDQNESGDYYISIIMGASDKAILYNNMTQMLEVGILSQSTN